MTKVAYEFDPFELLGIDDSKLSKRERDRVLDEIADFVLEQVLVDVGTGLSPVTGEKFPALSKSYVEQKKAMGGTVTGKRSNLELHGDMLDSLQVIRKGGKLTLTVSEDQQEKADGHNNFSGNSPLAEKGKLRPFIPNAKKSQTFRPKIRKGIEGIIRDLLGDEDD